MGKRGNGEGSIYRRKDGRWAARYSFPSWKVERVWRWIYAQTRDEAGRRLREALTARGSRHRRRRSEPNPGDLLSDMVGSHEALPLRARSWERYEEHVRLYLTPTLGRLRLAGDLRPSMFNGCMRGCSPRVLARRRYLGSMRRSIGLWLRPCGGGWCGRISPTWSTLPPRVARR